MSTSLPDYIGFDIRPTYFDFEYRGYNFMLRLDVEFDHDWCANLVVLDGNDEPIDLDDDFIDAEVDAEMDFGYEPFRVELQRVLDEHIDGGAA